MAGMFGFAEAFNQPIGGWITSSVTNMAYMFFGAIAFNEDITTWSAEGASAFDFEDMFSGATAWLDKYEYTGNIGVCNQEAPFGPAECWSVIITP
ncbi:hypothetical protein TrRE_jg4537 [Triparma retinervis]|uniref:BspA family leucine-rich repeat surface protein n=1 Tax=Triparma retinervis TaxID=2557542 RepID=A0A9W6ZX86_9STRA|nr:hypothetical protein TrRE_jg4537 [Triparma retinervis]